MIGNTLEYLQANNQTFQIMQMIRGNPIFNDLKPITPSEVVNLSLDILRILIQIHDESGEDVRGNQRLIQDISESSNSFVRFADISIDVHNSNNEDLINLLEVLAKADDKEELISRMLIYGTDLYHEGGNEECKMKTE